jgi:hypothetical protein
MPQVGVANWPNRVPKVLLDRRTKLRFAVLPVGVALNSIS